jgi:hypothetical protein
MLYCDRDDGLDIFIIKFQKKYDDKTKEIKEEENPVMELKLEILAKSLEEAIKQAWQTVTLSPERYFIIWAEQMMHYRRNNHEFD